MIGAKQYIYPFFQKIIEVKKAVRNNGLLLIENYCYSVLFFQFGKITHPDRGNPQTSEIPNPPPGLSPCRLFMLVRNNVYV